MRLFLSALVISLGLSLAAQAQNAEIEANISAQIEAFKADDFDAAFSYASPNIRQIFRTPENFGAMVRGGYPMVWRPGNVQFLELREIAGRLWQKVLITDAQGAIHILDYQMIKLESGWKINGVQILQAPGAAA
ncbi:protein of unknown function [Cribrihabitans marinus]|uniref:DUF4864 domain-containing protein n=1 Tax=Cribrihabitans marinus TaxID=1227549 RepID=A0A1H7CQ91_9RHOB|nr:DUF4864 domain-containing protein [Cribrihabitans marinus]GGH36015.1 hypothetical protein GCM10010973_29720 [Cribrihabitans marinus]SEJ90727.1 protein of unknown function [Cribrihabitans marinus]